MAFGFGARFRVIGVLMVMRIGTRRVKEGLLCARTLRPTSRLISTSGFAPL